MVNQSITIDRVRFYAETAQVTLVLTKNIPAIVKDENGAFVVGESPDIYIKRKAFLAQVAEKNELFKQYLSVREEPMTKAALNAVFYGAEMIVERELHQPGEVIGEYVVENQMFITKVVEVKFTEKAVKGMNAKIDAAF